MMAQGETRYMIVSEIPEAPFSACRKPRLHGRMSGRLAVVHHGKPELLFVACDQLGNEDTWWASFGLVCYLCVLSSGLSWFGAEGISYVLICASVRFFRPSFPYKLDEFYSF
jgi:hypothetical protein